MAPVPPTWLATARWTAAPMVASIAVAAEWRLVAAPGLGGNTRRTAAAPAAAAAGTLAGRRPWAPAEAPDIGRGTPADAPEQPLPRRHRHAGRGPAPAASPCCCVAAGPIWQPGTHHGRLAQPPHALLAQRPPSKDSGCGGGGSGSGSSSRTGSGCSAGAWQRKLLRHAAPGGILLPWAVKAPAAGGGLLGAARAAQTPLPPCAAGHWDRGRRAQQPLLPLPLYPLLQQRAFRAAQPPSRPPLPGSSLTSLPNLLSLSRVASGPVVACLIAAHEWPLAVSLTVAAAATDWLDGALARRLGHVSKLGSYLDPLADKVLVSCVVGTMGWLGMVPGWLSLLVVGRDAAQVAGMAWYRLRMFGGAWPGAAAFFDVDGGGAGALPAMRPLLVSKANTALVLLLVASCMLHEWQGVPDRQLLGVLELATAGTAAASGAAYARLFWTGRLLPPSGGAGGGGESPRL